MCVAIEITVKDQTKKQKIRAHLHATPAII